MYSIYKFYMVSSGEGNGNPLQYSCLGNSMDKGAWRATVRGVAKSRTQLSDYTHTHTHTHTVSSEVLQSEIYIYMGSNSDSKAHDLCDIREVYIKSLMLLPRSTGPQYCWEFSTNVDSSFSILRLTQTVSLFC